MWVFFVKQKTAYEMRISDWSSDVCSSDLQGNPALRAARRGPGRALPQLAGGRQLAAARGFRGAGRPRDRASGGRSIVGRFSLPLHFVVFAVAAMAAVAAND